MTNSTSYSDPYLFLLVSGVDGDLLKNQGFDSFAGGEEKMVAWEDVSDDLNRSLGVRLSALKLTRTVLEHVRSIGQILKVKVRRKRRYRQNGLVSFSVTRATRESNFRA